ncbi:DUF2786 domain-containing protein [Vandammella animalimorsus]|uniref:Uncharacterized protein n=1 Tax=Vandammella animalimorsus TaxID=2029117 RepID=A0A2A2AB25_9BURK|nr:DUF2786 domain-containing protein [Vandammella animalimorsus]PAT34934.1 hypothetical protein CK625_12500 [Vandammella animalimorsus]
MTRDEALIKIKKCMALRRSAEPHEAAAALRQAQKLMEMFNLSERALEVADVHEEKINAQSSGQTLWEGFLANCVAGAFGCEYYLIRRREYTTAFETRTTWQYVFVGLDAAPTLAGYAFDVLGRQCYRARAAHIKLQPKRCKPSTKTARGDDFAIGWVMAAAAVVQHHAQPQRNEELLLEYMAERHPNMTTIKPRDSRKGKNVSGHAQEGYRQGQGAQLHHGVGQREQALIGRG